MMNNLQTESGVQYKSGNMTVEPISDALGAEIKGVNLSGLNDQVFSDIHAAWLKHSVLLFRNQDLSHDDLIAFSRRFGVLDHAPVNENGRDAVPGIPELYIISNVVDDTGRPIGSLGSGEAVWHTDMSYLPHPPDASALYSVEIPDTGGDTWFLGMIAATEALPDDLRSRIQHMSVKHDGTYNSGGYLRKGVRKDDNPATSEGAIHPIICCHPETGKECLYLGRRRNAWIVGLERNESDTLLDQIWDHVTQDIFVYRHVWNVGDLVIWDNRTTMHRRDAFDNSQRRVMHRTQISGSARPRSS